MRRMGEVGDVRGLTHREVAGRLVAGGWSVCGVGDWATVWRSPEGKRAARVSPFELAYGVFVDLCRKLADNVMMPRVYFDAELGGGGRVTVMEFLRPADEAQVSAILKRWDVSVAGDPIADVRAEAERLGAVAADVIPYWGGLDLNEANVMVDLDGQAKIVDLFATAGKKLFAALMEEPASFAARIPAEQRRFMTEIGYAQRVWTPAQITAYREAATTLP
jgi:hypothetical protein